MMRRFKRLLVAVLTFVFLVVSGVAPEITTTRAMAAGGTNVEELANAFPEGIILYSDTFPGLHVTYDAQESYVIREGKNEVSLGVSVTDKKLADLSATALKTIFGKVRIPADKGETFYTKSFVIGVATRQYEDIVLRTGNVSLYNLVKGLASKDAKEAVSAYAGFLIKLSEVVQFMENEESKASETQPQKSDESDDGQEGDGQSDESNDGQEGDGQDDNGDKKELCDRTILIYLDGTNLETEYGLGTKNLLDLLRTRMPEGVKIYVVTGGTKTWHMNDPKTYRDYVKNLLYPKTLDSDLTVAENAQIDNMAGNLLSKYRTNISGLQFWEVVSDGTVNRMVNRQTYIGQYMTDPKFFARIIDYGAPEDPDCKYDLIIWDHGGGITGYGADDILDQYKKDHEGEDLSHLPDTTFSLEQMRQAIADSDYIKNGGKFDFIGFDACLMASYEVASTLKDFSHYYIGSEEIEPGAGWDYMALFTALSENPGMSTRDLGSKIIDSFLEQYKGNNESTLSLVDMTGVDELDDAISNFAEILLKELEVNEYDSSIYLQIMNNVGKRAHFYNRNGYYTSNYLDLKRLVSIFASNDLGFSKELRNASEEVLNRLDECVLYNKWLEKDVENGGLSIYFPLAAYYVADSEKEGESYYNNTASKAVKIYNESDINEEYKRAVARFALLSIAGKMVGQDWQDLKINDTETIVSKIKSDYDWKENWRLLYEAAKVDESDANDPTLKDFEKILADRITRNDITVTKPDSRDNPAMVEVAKPQSLAVGDVVEVNVELFDKDNHYIGSLGNTSQYSKYEEYEDNKAVYGVNPYDMLWYLLNGQICSMYITTEYDDGSYQGYIPVCYWADAQSASNLDMKDGESRKEYLKRAAKEGKVSTVYLNVFSDKNGENFEVVSYSTVHESSGTVDAACTNMSELHNKYYELLGGMDNFFSYETPAVFSLGTIYYEEKEKLNVTKDYISDVGQSYYISDTYGNAYYLTDDYLGGEGKGLSNYYKYIPDTDEDGKPIDPMTWEKSLLKAEEVREAAAQEAAKASEEGNSTSTALDQEAVAAKSTDVAAEETEKEIVTETSDLTAETVTKNAEPASEEALEEVKEEEASEEVTEEEALEEVTEEEALEEVTDEEAAEEVTDEEPAEEVVDEEPAEEVVEEEPAEEVVEEETVEKPAEEIAEEPVAKPEAEEKGEETTEKIEEQIPEALPLETNTEVTTEDD